MNQSNFIFFALLLAFVVYVTMRGELPTYMGFFVPNPNAGSQGPFSKLASTTGSVQNDTPATPKVLSPSNPANQAQGNAIIAGNPWNDPIGALWNGLKQPGTITGVPFLP